MNRVTGVRLDVANRDWLFSQARREGVSVAALVNALIDDARARGRMVTK